MDIRPALSEDAETLCAVIRRSIVELCVADHHDDPAILDAWLANKTPDTVHQWIGGPTNAMLVAVEGDAILAGGCVTTSGEIVLNYVSPDARFRGVSRAMLAALEARSREWDNTISRLDSTATALGFYTSAGYARTGDTVGKLGLIGYPMRKSL